MGLCFFVLQPQTRNPWPGKALSRHQRIVQDERSPVGA